MTPESGSADNVFSQRHQSGEQLVLNSVGNLIAVHGLYKVFHRAIKHGFRNVHVLMDVAHTVATVLAGPATDDADLFCQGAMKSF